MENNLRDVGYLKTIVVDISNFEALQIRHIEMTMLVGRKVANIDS